MVSYKRGDICSSPEILDLYKKVSISKEYIQKNQKEIEQASKRQQEAFEQMQKDYEEACKAREDEGIVKIIAGAGAAVLGVTAIVLTAGAATPIVVTAAVSGTCSTLYGVSNIIEGTEDVYYASIGDLDSKAVNPIRDTVFMGNQEAYDVCGSLSMTVAGLCVPVSQSVNMVAGSSGSVIAKTVTSTVAKELAIDGTIDIVSENVTEYVSDKLELSGTEAALLNMGISYALEGGVDSIENRLTGNKTSFAKDMNYDDARRYNEYWDNLEKGNSTGYPGLSEDDIKKWDFANKKVDEQIALNKVDPDEMMGVRMNEAGVKLDSIKGGIESGTVTESGTTTISSADRIKIDAWDYTPSDELYSKYKNVFDNPKYYNQKTGAINWPKNDGFASTPIDEVLQPGTRIDRYGSDFGSFTSPEGIPYEMRAVAPGTDLKPYSVFEVVEPINVKAGEIAPWFDEPGGGIQYLLPDTVDELLDAGILRRIK